MTNELLDEIKASSMGKHPRVKELIDEVKRLRAGLTIMADNPSHMDDIAYCVMAENLLNGEDGIET